MSDIRNTAKHLLDSRSPFQEKLDISGHYELAFFNCHENASLVSVSGTITWKSPYCYLPTDQVALLTARVALLVLYIALLVTFLTLKCIHEKADNSLQSWVLCMGHGRNGLACPRLQCLEHSG